VAEDYDLLVLLQPTSPLRTAADIDGAVQAMIEQDAPACISVCLSDRSPYWLLSLDENQRLSPVMRTKLATRRQDLPPVYHANGAVYAARCHWIREHDDFLAPETVAYVMPKERSIDIDDETDLLFAELLWQKLADESREAAEGGEERRARA
jgi:CMP-N,N'-diacetyllegionaminic acid synthase